MSSVFSKQEQAIIKGARECGEYYSYEVRRAKFYELLRRIGKNPSSHYIKFAYAIGQNLVLDESDIVDIIHDVWGLSSSDIYRAAF